VEENKLKELLAYAEFYHDAGLSVIQTKQLIRERGDVS
jgi:hypothetical protein